MPYMAQNKAERTEVSMSDRREALILSKKPLDLREKGS